ncbi:hypothetical protein [Pseudanabaena yagii]|uniref:Lipocalin-like domain-containing protein n=1 Tax=Pseudanabaena yagii GIHE-NHR1 TaxID=2722753 RepID=A0ABX1LSE9_9CYAN|nr:hypothetical protein [Pseudanabaena yagii]NMF59088.1 hypothetical protein [Pseudanabaena yagii GIHE-NHR1]
MKSFSFSNFLKTFGVTLFSALIMFGERVCGENYDNKQVAKQRDLTGVWTIDYTPLFTSNEGCSINTIAKFSQIKRTYINGRDLGNKITLVQKANKLISPPILVFSPLLYTQDIGKPIISSGIIFSTPNNPVFANYSSGSINGNQIVFDKYAVEQNILSSVLNYTGTISADGNKIVGTVVCHASSGSRTAQGNFQWTRHAEDQLSLINLLARFYDFPSFP